MAAVCLGATVIEKHFTLDRSAGGPDASFSLEPSEFRALVDAVRNVERAISTVHYGPTEFDQANLHFRRSLFVVNDMNAGDPFTDTNVRSIRPGPGLEPRYLDQILGQTAATDIPRGTPLSWKHVA